MTFSRLVDLEVDVSTLKLRVDALEARLTGNIGELDRAHPLFPIYSHLLISRLERTEETAVLLRTCVMQMTPRTLLDLGRMTNDMFPWRPFLGALDQLHLDEFDVLDATEWLELCARELLRAQGLGILKLEDVVRSPTGPVHNMRESTY